MCFKKKEGACFNKALKYALLLLKYRARSEDELKKRLDKRGYDPCLIQQVADYLKERKYIDDEDFVRAFTDSSLKKGWGQNKICFALKRFGIEDNFIAKALENREIYRERLRELADKKKRYYKGPRKYQKLVRFLVSRGFFYDDIYSALEEIGVERQY